MAAVADEGRPALPVGLSKRIDDLHAWLKLLQHPPLAAIQESGTVARHRRVGAHRAPVPLAAPLDGAEPLEACGLRGLRMGERPPI